MSLGQSRIKKKNQFEKTNLSVCECEVGEPHAVASLKIAMIMIDSDKNSEDGKLRFIIIMIDNDNNYVMFGRTLYILMKCRRKRITL